MFKWFLKRLWNNVSSTRAERRRARRKQMETARPWAECLEDRVNLTTTLTGSAGGTLSIAITGADTVNVSVNGTGHLVVNDTTASVVDSTTGPLFGGVTAATATETASLATDNFTAISITGDAAVQTLNFVGGSFTDSNNVTVTATAGLESVNFTTATSAFSGNLSVSTTTAISQSTAIIGTTASFSAGANAITLTNAGNSFSGAVTLNNSGANNVQLTNSIATSLAASTVGQNLTIISGGGITQTGALTVPGTLTTSSATGSNLSTATNAVASFNASNSGIGAVNLLDSAGTLTITGITDATAGGSVTVNNIGGAISLAGTIGAGSNTVNLTANTSITQTPAGSTVTAGALNIAAASIGTVGQSLVFNANSLLTANTSASNGNQFLADTAAVSVGVGAINAGTGVVTLTGGTFQAASTTAFSGGNVTDNATIDLNGNSNSAAAFNGSGSVIDSGAAATFTVTGGGSFSGNIGGANTALTVGGATQSLTLSGNDTYGGLTTISSGDTLKAGSATGFSANSTVTDNGTLDLAGFSNSVGGLGGNGSVTNSAASGTAALTITGAGNFSGVISNGGNATTAITITGSANETFSGTSANTYTGLTTVSGGTLILSKTASVTAVAGNVSISGGTLTNNASNQFATTTALTQSGGLFNSNPGSTAQSFASLTISGGTFGTNSNAITVSGATTISGAAILNLSSGAGGSSYSTSSLAVSGGNVNIGNNAATTQTLTVGSGGLNFSGGSILVGNSGPGVSGAIATLVLNGDVTASNTVAIGTNGNPATQTLQVDLGGGAPRTFSVTGTLTVAPSLIDGALTKTGAGTLTLSGASTYVGATSVSAGTLKLTGSVTSNVTVSSGATLSGAGNGSTTGKITGTLTVNSGGNLAPTSGIGTPLTVTGNATLSSGANFNVVITSALTGNYGQLAVAGTSTINGANLLVSDPSSTLTTASQQTIRILSNTGGTAVVGTFAGLPEGSPVTVSGSAVTPTITYNGALANNIDLNTQPVVNGTPGNDSFVFRKSLTPGDNEYSTNGGASFITIANNLGVTFNGGAGADTLTYDYVNGDPGVSVTFNGGGQSGDTLIVKGAGSGTAVYAVNTSATPQHAGSVTVGSDVIAFTGLSPADVEGFANVNINNTTFTAANQAITIANGTDSGGNPSINVSGTTGGTAFETLRLRNDTSVSIDTTTPAGNDTVTVTSANGAAAQANISNLTINTGTGADTVSVNGAISLPGNLSIATQTLNLTAGTIAAANINLTASGAITESGASLLNTTGTLTTNSGTGTTLGNANTVSTFNAANSSSGSISLTNTAAPLTITGITETGGGITVSNTGNLTTSGTILDNTTGNAISLTATNGALTLGAAVTGTGADTIGLTSTGANNIAVNAAVTTGSGAINANSGAAITETGAFGTSGLLTANAVSGVTLNGANAVGSFNATNTTSGSVSLTNTAAPLTVTGITETGGAITVANTGGLTTSGTILDNTAGNAISLTATNGAVTIGAPVTGTATDTISLTSTGGVNSVLVQNAVSTGSANITVNAAGAITESGSGSFATTGTLSTTSVTGQTLSGAGTNAVATFTATNSTSNPITLTNTIGTLTVIGITQTPGANVSVTNNGNLTTSTNPIATGSGGAISLQATGGLLTVGAAVTAGGGGAVNLTSTGATDDVEINAAVSSGSGTVTVLAGRNIAFGAGGSVTTGGNVSLTSSIPTGTVTQATAATSVTATSGNLAVTAGGGVGTGGQPLVFNVNTLASNSAASNANQFLTDTATAHLAVTNALNAGTGAITLVSGTFQITNGASGNNVNTINDNSPLIVNTPAILDLNGRNETVWSLAGTGSVTLGSGTFITGNSSGDTPNFSGAISGTGGVTKLGSDDWTLSGTNTYTGTTNVGLTAAQGGPTNGGTLTVTGVINNTAAAAGGIVNLNFAGVTLNGAGTIKGQVTVAASTFASKTLVQNVTISVPATAVSATGLSVLAGAVFAQIGTTSAITVNGGNATSTGMLIQGSALIENSMILAQNVDVDVNAGTAALQGDTLTPGTGSYVTGLLVTSGAIVDAGQLAASATPLPNGPAGNVGYYGDITGLFSPTGTPLSTTNHSSGNNVFGTAGSPFSLDTSATATPNPGPNIPQAIRNENTGTAPFGALANGVEQSFNYGSAGPLLGRMDTTAQNDTWNGNANLPIFQIEQLVFHDIDDNSVGFVTYGNTSAPAPVVTTTPLYSANFNLSAAQGGTDTLVPGTQPVGVGHQKSVIRGIQVVFSSYVFLDPDLQSPITNRGLDLTKVNGPYAPSTYSPIAAGVATTSYNRVTGAYTVTYDFSGPGTEYASLQDGNYTLQFNESAIQGGGPGGPALSTAGDPYASNAASFYRFFGDTQGRAEVNNLDSPSDLALMRQALGSVLGGANTANYLAYLDFGDSGYINGAVYTAFLRRYNYMLNTSTGTVTTITTPGTTAAKPLKTTVANGVLTMTGTTAGVGQLQALEIIRTTGNSFQVIDDATVTASGLTGGTGFGTFNNVHAINLNFASLSENIIINLNGGTLPGNININLGKGNANPSASPALQVSIIGAGTAADRIGGNVLITGGSGQDTVVIGGLPPDDLISPLSTAVTIGGNVTFTAAAQAGYQGNALTVEAGSAVNGNVIVSQVSTVTIGDYGFAGGFVGGNLIVNDHNSAVAADVAILGRVGGIVSVNGTTGGAVGGDLFAISNNGTGTPGSVGGSAVINTGSGANSVFTDAGTVLGGSLNLFGGSGGNTTQIAGAIGGSLLLFEGNGANSVNLTASSTVNGNLTMYGGNGSNSVDLAGAVNGSAYFSMGNGTNSVLLDTTGSINGNTFRYIGGTHSDTVTLDNGAANGFALYVTFLAGTRSLILDPGSTPGSAVIDFGVGFGSKTLNYNGQIVTWNQTLRNYP